MGKKKQTEPTTEAPTVQPTEKPPRKREGVWVGIPTVKLTDEQADALAFGVVGMVPADRREVAKLARAEVVRMSTGWGPALDQRIVKLHEHRLELELAEVEAIEKRAIEAADALRAKRQAGAQAGGESAP